MQPEIAFLTGWNYMLVKVYNSLWKLFLQIRPRKLNTIRSYTWPRCISILFILVTWPNKNASSNLGHTFCNVPVNKHLFLTGFLQDQANKIHWLFTDPKSFSLTIFVDVLTPIVPYYGKFNFLLMMENTSNLTQIQI